MIYPKKSSFEKSITIIKNEYSITTHTFKENWSLFLGKSGLRLYFRIRITEEIKKLQKELEYTKGFLRSVENKLNNEQFINNAPEKVISNEKNKMADAKSKIEILEKKVKDLV